MTVLSIPAVGPHDFELSLRIAMSFSPDPLQDFSVLRSAVRIGETQAVLELRQVRRDPAHWRCGSIIPTRIVGRYLGRGQRLSPQGTMRKLSPFKPYRGLAAFYLLAHERSSKRLTG
jgi:hypothetical protein